MMEPGRLVTGLREVYRVEQLRGFWEKQSWLDRGRSGSRGSAVRTKGIRRVRYRESRVGGRDQSHDN